MKRYIKFSEEDVTVMDDRIIIDLDVYFTQDIYSSATCKEDLFPGAESFREDVVKILEEKYNFQVIEDNYNGKLQKGHCSNRSDSISVYLDTYFDFSVSQDVVKSLDAGYLDIPEDGIVHCFIHLRFSDHSLPDDGDVAHRQFLSENAKKYAERNPGVTHYLQEEDIGLDSRLVYRKYHEALDDLQDAIENRMVYWMKHLNRLKRVSRS